MESEDEHEEELAVAADTDDQAEPSMIQGTDALMTVVDMQDNSLAAVEAEAQEYNDYSEDDVEDESEDDSDKAHDSNDKKSPRHEEDRKMARHTGPNGHQPVDRRPPEKLLQKAEKKVARYIERKKVDRVIYELIRCTALSRLVYGDRNWHLARAYTKLASAYFDLKGYSAQAIYHAEISENMLRNHLQLDSYTTDKPLVYAVLVETYFTLGRALMAEKKLAEAEAALSKSEKVLSELSGMPLVLHDDIEGWTIKLCLAIGRLNFRRQKFAVSLTYFERALDMMQEKYGHDSPQLISVYQSLGRVEQGKGRRADHMRAIEHFLQAHSIASASFSEDGVETAETAYALALAYTNVQDDDAEHSAESYLNQALSTYEGLYGSGHAKTLEVKDELARLMIRTDRVEEAISLLLSTIELKQDRYGDLSQQVAQTWKIIGTSYLSVGKSQKALNALKKCHEIELAVYGTKGRSTKDTQRTINLLLSNPNLAAKQKKTKEQELKERPRFSSVAKVPIALGGFKPQL